MKVHQYKPGDPEPTPDARRYHNASGYVRLRWRGPDGSLYECYEHRWVMRCFDPTLHVHHRNGVKDDNRPENLEVVTPAEHNLEHRAYDWDEVRRLYASGLSTIEVCARLGVDPSQVSRILSKFDEARTISESLSMDLDDDTIRELHVAGVSARRIAKLMGVSSWAIDRRVKLMGLAPNRQGRPTDEALERQAAAVEAWKAAS